MPIYLLKQTLTEGHDTHTAERLVEAKNVNQAINHVAADSIQAEKCDSADLIRLTKDGVNVEKAA